MTPICTFHTNKILKPPPDFKGECIDLPVSHYQDVFYSYWQPSFKEKIKILLGWSVRLSICSDVHPSVALDVDMKEYN